MSSAQAKSLVRDHFTTTCGNNPLASNTAFTVNGFDDQERNWASVKTNFQVLKLVFHACNFKQTFYPLHKRYIA